MNIYNNTDQIINPNMYIPTKVCSKCRTIKYITVFNKRKTTRDGYIYTCRNCINNRHKEYYDTIKNDINQPEIEYYHINKSKTCNTCNQIKCVTEFYKDKTKYDGYHSQCKNCHNNRQKEYYVTNKDKKATKGFEYRENNTEKIKEDKIKYYQNNKDKIKENKKKNKDKLIEHVRNIIN